ncbi:unnamed protein product [Adineta steineri]|uniref:Uncharacterized protein n=1 Tax=Adineta steineri TaxID=433720 RepID=A0A815GFT7_9BILA|nr:unnamed protein product [Adineta steineri]CAF1592234.1 unnamed protein product [Adineta steineri]
MNSNRAEQAVSPLLSTVNNKEERYQPKTIQQHNRGRYAYLPIFPTKSFGPSDDLLLANVPASSLTAYELVQRQQGADTNDALTMMNNYMYSDPEGFSLSEQDANELAIRLQVGKSIITFNANRLRSICYTFLALHKRFRRKVLEMNHITLDEPVLNSKHMALALEFYLQIDVDVFYMKTCSYRETADSYSIDNMSKGLFYDKDELQTRYNLIPCDSLFCSCCHPRNTTKRSHSWSVIDFQSSSTHQFVNGYTTYLNWPATCDTSNIIYAMTCPCQQYDYVESTENTLHDAMNCMLFHMTMNIVFIAANIDHRKHGNRIIHETLTGTRLYRGSIVDPMEKQKEIANKMRLYQHSAQCPIALRSFLDCNPDYWCFVPILWADAVTENIIYFRTRSSTNNLEETNISGVTAIDNQRVLHYLEHVPQPPAPYDFSYQQRQKQRQFFERFLTSPFYQLPYSPLDLYRIAIIAILPNDRSIILRYIIETLFILHGETKLNMICPLGGDPYQRYGPPYSSVWCANLNDSGLPSATAKTTTV